MTPAVEIFSATDPVYSPERDVRYWLEFGGRRSERRTDWATINARAIAICAEHDTVLIDRSDRDSGLLRRTLGQ